MLWLDGFFMAWGMFFWIPVPVKRWNEAARGQMLCCMPLIGLMLGLIWAAAAWLLRGLPPAVYALCLAVLPWLLSGFMHLDGFMDVCDAAMSRRELETRQKILKDSRCGAFAVIGLVLLVLAQWCVLFSAERPALLPLALLPVTTRLCAAVAMQTVRPMTSSQYAAMPGGISGRVIVPAVILAALVVFLPLGCGGAGFSALAAVLGYGFAALYGVRRLGGINGDISGFALSIGELAGLAVLCLVR